MKHPCSALQGYIIQVMFEADLEPENPSPCRSIQNEKKFSHESETNSFSQGIITQCLPVFTAQVVEPGSTNPLNFSSTHVLLACRNLSAIQVLYYSVLA